jgi:DNA-binding response OmpR family regulator
MPNDTSIRPRTGGLRILVLDDNCDAADSLGQLMVLWGYQPVIAYGGQTAVELARIYRPDVALLDLAVPHINGFDVGVQLRQQSESKDAVLIAVTGFDSPELRRRSLTCGFAHYLVKPVDPEDLRTLLDRLRARLLPELPSGKATKRVALPKRRLPDGGGGKP